MPAATPVPRGPMVLTLYSAADLLTGPGCPVCRYAAEASDRYLGWFALEGHSDPALIAVLRESLGMCARHTRSVMRQPGAPVRLTAVYRYVMAAARDQLAGQARPVRRCPACEHDRAAAGRALETLADGLAGGEALDRCRELGGVCIPHLRSAAATGPRRVVAWLADTLREAVSARLARPGWLAGTDTDAQVRAELRRALPHAGTELPGACAACLAAALAERDCLADLTATARGAARGAAGAAEAALSVCGGHLADLAATAATPADMRMVLGWQAYCLTARIQPSARRAPGWPRAVHRRDRDQRCLVCRARAAAADGTLTGVATATHAAPGMAHHGGLLCARHYLSVRDLDAPAARALARGHVIEADQISRDLVEAFERATPAARHMASTPDSSAWRRAAAFLDGGVTGGLPPLSRGAVSASRSPRPGPRQVR